MAGPEEIGPGAAGARVPAAVRSAGRLHVGVIMDGNGRWAQARGLRRTAGHQRGAEAVRRVVEAAPGLGITDLTLYAFSSDNWERPRMEVRTLLRLFRRYLRSETEALRENGVRLSVIGRRDRLPGALLAAIRTAEAATAGGQRLDLRVAIDYSARGAIAAAARAMAAGTEPFPASGDECAGQAAFARAMAEALGSRAPLPDVDLLVRSGGEQRLSDFLLWECAYAELFFTDCMWPDFGGAELAEAVAFFHGRERRFGRVLRAAV